MSNGEIIRNIREQRGWTIAQFAARIGEAGTDEKTVRNWEKGRVELNAARLIKAARAFGYDTWEELLSDNHLSRPFSQIDPGDSIPVFEEIPAGNGDFDPSQLGEDNGHVSDFELGKFPLSAIHPKLRHLKQLFAVVVKGDSMEPDYSDGELVFCAVDAKQEQGMVAAYRLNNGECGLKVLERHGEEAFLIPRNPKYGVKRVLAEEVNRVCRVVAHLKCLI